MSAPSNPPPGTPAAPQTIVLQQPAGGRAKSWIIRLLLIALLVSIALNVAQQVRIEEYFTGPSTPTESFHSGDRDAEQKIALLKISGTIMPPVTGRVLKTIEKISDDDAVKGVVVAIDSPGGLVADSHQIYHHLKELSEKKPMVVTMKRLAASGGYYVAMGAGPEAKIYAEPTTWTGSIGVIIPRYNLSEFAANHGIQAEPLMIGEHKDSLSWFQELPPEEEKLWREILQESYDQFVDVIAENRGDLDEEQVRELATGQVYTAKQALENQLIDEIGFEDDAIDDITGQLKEKLGTDKFRVVTYRHPVTLMEVFTGSIQARRPEETWRTLLESTVPRAMYFFSWAPSLPPGPVVDE